MKKVIIECNNCGKKVEKPKCEIDRQKRKGRKIFYCGRSCAGSSCYSHLKKYTKENAKYLEGFADNRRDEYSPFRVFMRTSKRRKETDLDLQYLKDLWENQNGKCAITNIEMSLDRHHAPFQASLDRIDNDKGYIKGNVRFICLITNYARNTWNDDIVKEFITKATL
jgi:hypothetical protein